jgi:rhodanese-related sulfurtransferase
MSTPRNPWLLLLGFLPAILTFVGEIAAQGRPAASAPNIMSATLAETDAKTTEISTEELQRLMTAGSVLLLDARPHLEWAISHIPGARNVAAKPGMPISQYVSDVAEVERLVNGDKSQVLVLYCNGPFCGKSKRLADELLTAGFSSVRRYQLGAPVWRALGGLMVIEPDGVRYVVKDPTAVFLDVRDPEEFQAGSVQGARNLPRSKVLPGKDVGEVKAAKDDGRLPMEDHNTRLIVFGRNAEQAKAVAEAVAREAFHNVSYFAGTYAQLSTLLRN